VKFEAAIRRSVFHSVDVIGPLFLEIVKNKCFEGTNDTNGCAGDGSRQLLRATRRSKRENERNQRKHDRALPFQQQARGFKSCAILYLHFLSSFLFGLLCFRFGGVVRPVIKR